MPRSKTQTFKTEFQLRVTRKQTRELERSFEAARQLDNYLKGYVLKRVRLIRESKDWQAARKLPKGEPKSKERIARAHAFQAVKTQYGIEQTSLERKARAFGVDEHGKDNCIGACFPTHVEQKIALRVLGAAERMLYGQSRRLRFKTKGSGVKSLENKSNASGIRFREVDGKWGIHYQDLFLPVLFNERDQCHQHALEHRVKYSQIIRYKRKGKTRFKVQLVQEGEPSMKRYQKNGQHTDFKTHYTVKHQAGDMKHPPVKGRVGIDIGPSKYALVGIATEHAMIGRFCDDLKTNEKEVRLKARHLDRQRRANNPENYEPNFQDKHGHWKQGPVKKGSKKWIVSTRQRKVQEELNESERALTATRKTSQLTLKNQTLQLGNEFYFEKVSLKAWQKMWGKSIKQRAPGIYMRSLKQLAESADFTVNEFPTRNTYLSQRCQCGGKKKKLLSERTHKCSECGRVMDRDLYSAYLATAVIENGEYCANQLSDWSGWEAILHAAWTLAYNKGIPATDAPSACIEPEDSPPALSGLHEKREQSNAKTQDVVVNRQYEVHESRGEAEVTMFFRTA
jgi:transposase